MSWVSYAAVAIAVAMLWTARRSWKTPWERPAMVNVVLQTLNIAIVFPQGNLWISIKLHTLTGIWNCEELIGHICYMVGMFSLLYLVASRLEMTRAQFRAFFRYRIELPLTLLIPLMVALFVQGPGKAYVTDLEATNTTKWLHAYWLLTVWFVAYILFQAVNGLRILRQDPRSRRAANAYLVAVSVSASCCLAFALEQELVQWLLVRGEVVAYAVAAGFAWYSKQRVGDTDDYLMPA